MSKKAATFGREDDSNDERPWPGLFSVDVADDVRKGKVVLNKAARLRRDDDDDNDDKNDDNDNNDDNDDQLQAHDNTLDQSLH